MAHLARSQARYCAKRGKLIHSDRPALKGGENLCCGSRNMSPKNIVKSWMTSPGHRAWLLDSRVRSAGVGIARSKHGTYAAWAFSDQPISFHNIINIPKIQIPFLKHHKQRGGRGVLRLPVKVFLLCAAIISIVLGVHGVWVYFSRLELLFGGNAAKLFLSVDLPERIRSMIEWMSMKGFQSWFIPTIFIILGLIIWGIQSNIYVGDKFGWLRKLHLW